MITFCVRYSPMKRVSIVLSCCIFSIFNKRTAYRCIGPDEKVCCVKKISLVDSSANATAKHSQMIQKEIYILTNLNHPRIIRFFSYFTVAKDRHIYIAMEYASNGALSSYLAERRSRLQYLEEDVSYCCFFVYSDF